MISTTTKKLRLKRLSDNIPVSTTNYFHLYGDVTWFGILFGSTISFLAVFATRMGAAAWQIGFLAAGPAVVNIVLTMPVGRWLNRQDLGQVVTKSAIWHRLGYFVLVPLPLLLPASMQVWAIMLLTLLMAIPGTALVIAFNAALATAIPEEDRGAVVGRRNALLGATIMLSFFGSGWILAQLSLELGYVIVFGLGAVGAAMSTYHLSRLRLPATPPFQYRPVLDRAHPARVGVSATSAPHRQTVGLRLWLNWPRRRVSTDQFSKRYRYMMIAYFAFHFAQMLPGALFPIFWVREVHLSDGEIAWVNALFYFLILVTSPLLGPLTKKLGNKHLNVGAAILLASYPLLTGLASDIKLLLWAAVLGGAAWAILSGSLVNRLLEFIPADQRPPHLALYNVSLNLATLGGMMLGPVMAEAFGLREALIAIAVLRVLSGLMLARWG